MVSIVFGNWWKWHEMTKINCVLFGLENDKNMLRQLFGWSPEFFWAFVVPCEPSWAPTSCDGYNCSKKKKKKKKKTSTKTQWRCSGCEFHGPIEVLCFNAHGQKIPPNPLKGERYRRFMDSAVGSADLQQNRGFGVALGALLRGGALFGRPEAGQLGSGNHPFANITALQAITREGLSPHCIDLGSFFFISRN